MNAAAFTRHDVSEAVKFYPVKRSHKILAPSPSLRPSVDVLASKATYTSLIREKCLYMLVRLGIDTYKRLTI